MVSIHRHINFLLLVLFLLLLFVNILWLLNADRWLEIAGTDVNCKTFQEDVPQAAIEEPSQNKEDQDDSNDGWIDKVQHLIIAGSQKGGTTALWKYLLDHPQVQGNKRRKEKQMELHFFDSGPKRRNLPNGTIHPEDVKSVLKAYQWYWNVTDPNVKVTMEKTPIYMFMPKVAHEIKSIVPSAKIIMALRDPVERAYSHYIMLNEKRYFKRMKQFFSKPLSFKECVEMDIEKLQESGFFDAISKEKDKDEGSNSDERNQAWMKYMNYPLQMRCESVVGRGLYATQLRTWWKLYSEEERNKQFLIMNSEDLRPDATSGMIDLKPVTSFLGISEVNVNGTEVIHASNYDAKLTDTHTAKNENMTRSLLYHFYAPFNEELEELLGKEWHDSWLGG